jgi:chaperone required for assembly of F1-ATPase
MKRFYKDVSIAEAQGGWCVLLDGKAIRTAAGAQQIVPARALAEEVATEWAGQGDEIDSARFQFRDLADYAIDIVAPDRARAITGILAFAESDTLCYRAEPDEPLQARQLEVWEPILIAAEHRWDVHFTRISGVIHQPQPAATLARLRAVLEAEDTFTIAALNTLASLTASLVIALAAVEPVADAEMLWNAAELEADWQVELWGKDAEAEALRAKRFKVFAAAMAFVQSLSQG